MALTEIKASKKINGEDKSAAIAYDFGATVEEAVEKFGADVVLSGFKKSAVITGQAAIRRMLEAGKAENEIASAMAGWKPGVALERKVDPVGALEARWDNMSDEEQKRVIALVKSKTKR